MGLKASVDQGPKCPVGMVFEHTIYTISGLDFPRLITLMPVDVWIPRAGSNSRRKVVAVTFPSHRPKVDLSVVESIMVYVVNV